MQIRYKIMSLAYIPLLCLIVQNANGFPFEIYSMSNELNISSLPRSIHPYLTFKQQTHHVPPKKTSQQIEDELLTILETMKQKKNEPVWIDPADVLESPTFLDKTLDFLRLKNVASHFESKLSCTGCKIGARLIQYYIHKGESNDKIINMIRDYCVNLRIQTARVCEGVSRLFGDEVIYVLKLATVQPHEICSFVMGESCTDTYSPNHSWDVTFPAVPKPAPKELPLPDDKQPVLKVLHISDTHYDPYYQEGANANCNEPLCCRASQGMASAAVHAAGKWGDYRKCDTPKRTIDHLLEHIADTHTDLDYVIWTGDLVPHDVWNQSKAHNLLIIKETVRQMAEKFPNTPIFPALGNHESSPVNSFPPPFVQEENVTISWLYDELDTLWSRWLPNTTSQTIRRGAFYSVLVRPGFRVITLNMNYCNNKNWWLLLNDTDPAAELQWLIYELQSAEFSQEKVHIIGHIPPGESDCVKVWSRNYYSIIARYESTIAAQFFGHTHHDQFEIFYDPQNLSRPINIAYIGPSVTPYENLNPGYRIYYIDGDHDATTRMVIDHENWVMNLDEANQYDYPIWYKLYTTRYAYSMPGLRPQDWNQLIVNMTRNDELFDLFHKHYWKNSPLRPKCKASCKKDLLCRAKSGRSYDQDELCHGLMSELNQNAANGWGEWVQNGINASDVNIAINENITNRSTGHITIEPNSSTADGTFTNEVTSSEHHKESPIVNEQYAKKVSELLSDNHIT